MFRFCSLAPFEAFDFVGHYGVTEVDHDVDDVIEVYDGDVLQREDYLRRCPGTV